MGFKKLSDFNEQKYKDFFTLRNDSDYADVIFLYRNVDDVLIADVHYIKSNEYDGYVHCVGNGCPACAKGIRHQTKLFIPLYNIQNQKIEFFDRSDRFENQLQKQVFANYPNPSEFVFRITRHGEAGDQNTTYEIRAIAKNSSLPYEQILANFNAVMPDYYSHACREVTAAELNSMLSANSATPTEDYVPVPRASQPVVDPSSVLGATVPDLPDLPEVEVQVESIPTPEFEPIESSDVPESDIADVIDNVDF